MAKRDLPASATGLIPERANLAKLRGAAADCEACDLYKGATQTVFGEGPAKAGIMFIGEMAGDAEDKEGRPFVGPAGRLFDRLLAEAGVDRKEAYVTNAVKHFKWEPRGKRRIHKTPNAREIAACRPWLEAEIAAVRPQVIVCLGATAAKVIFGKDFRVSEQRGAMVPSSYAPCALATAHPSSILRADSDEARHDAERRFIEDLKRIPDQFRR
ncbi:MAG: UdgX family uracil-DNA binding protein [Terriglobia bacterium]